MRSRRKKRSDGPKRGPGRPPLVVTGRQATKKKMEAILKAEKDEQALQLANLPPSGQDAVRESAMIAQSLRIGFQQLFKAENHGRLHIPDFLDSLPRDKGGWRQIATVRTLDVPFWFDMQRNDYNSKEFFGSSSVGILWIGHPFLSPKGAHARRFLVHWKDPLPCGTTMKELAISYRKPVMRWSYVCNGACSRTLRSIRWTGFSSAVEDEDSDTFSESNVSQKAPYEDLTDEDDESYYDSDDSSELEEISVLPRGHKCSGRVKLHLEILADNLDIVNIWMQNKHPNVRPKESLTWSRGLHNEVGYALRLFGVRPFTVMQNIVKLYGFPVDIAGCVPPGSSVAFPHTFPNWRLPTYKQVSNMLPAIKRRARVDRDPFEAITKMAHRYPDSIYCYVPHDINVPDSQSKFSCAIATNFSLEALILHGSEDGVGLDTSWRNKNENRAAVSFLIAVDRNGHLTPGSVFISANVQAETIKDYLSHTEERVKDRAAEIVKGGLDAIVHPRSRDKKDILQICQRIVESHQWFVRKWMIDKSSSLLSGIKMYDSEAMILVCQFHIVQAIIRMDGGTGRVANAPRIPYKLKFELVKAFREAQRCRRMDEWPTYHGKFMAALQDIIMNTPFEEEELGSEKDVKSLNNEQESKTKDSKSLNIQSKKKTRSKRKTKLQGMTIVERRRILEFLRKYFDDYWFSDYWLGHVTDMGLPDGETRDGTFYTN